MKKNLAVLASLGSVLAPVVAFAAVADTSRGTIGYIIEQIGAILNMVIPIMVIIAVIWFIWGVIKYVIASDEESKAKGRSMIIYGIVGIAVIVALWGFVNLLIRTLGVQGGGAIQPPTVLQ